MYVSFLYLDIIVFSAGEVAQEGLTKKKAENIET